MKVRHRECTQLLDTFLKMNAGISITNVFESSFDLKQFKVIGDNDNILINNNYSIFTYLLFNQNTINVENIVSMGFSFGGTTAMYNSAFDIRYRYVNYYYIIKTLNTILK